MLDTAAYHTLDNAINSKRLLTALHDAHDLASVTAITHDWHMPRSRRLFEAVYAGAWPDVPLRFVAVPTDPADPTVPDRTRTEARLIRELPRWLADLHVELPPEETLSPVDAPFVTLALPPGAAS